MKTQIITVEKMVAGGLGLCRTDQGVVFTEGLLPGETGEAIFDGSKTGGIPFATIVKNLKTSEHRRKPCCPLFGICGGCDWLHIDHPTQLACKQEIFLEALLRTGKIENVPIPQLFASPEFGYRRRVQFKVDQYNNALGFYRKKSNTVVNIPTCPLLCTALNETLKKSSLHKSIIRKEHLQVKVLANNQNASLSLPSNECASFPVLPGYTSASITIPCGGYLFPVSGNGFFQGNLFLDEAVGNFAKDNLEGETFVDLFGGSGFFSVFVAKKFSRGILVDDMENHITDAKKTFAINGITNVTPLVQDATAYCRQAVQNKVHLDCCIVDPPRTGVSRNALESIAAMHPKTIFYVSCNPVTQARDTGLLINKFKYQCTKTALFDFYPQTHHIESVMILQREV